MRNSKNSTEAKTELKSVIKSVAKIFRKHNLSYDQIKYVTKQARKQLGVTPPKSNNKGTVKRLSKTQLDNFIESAYDVKPTIGLMMLTLYETGTRVDEFVNLEATDLYVKEEKIIVKDGKGSKRREIPITKNLSRLLQSHLKDRDAGYLFMSNRNSNFTTRRIQQLVKDVRAKAKIEQDITPHTLRHTRGTLLVEAGMPKDYVQQFMGHESPETTEIYTRTAVLDLKKALDEISKS